LLVLSLTEFDPDRNQRQMPDLLTPCFGSARYYCGDTYKVATEDGKTRDFWERNLRFKTDVSADGPQPGVPALAPAGMMGDRADVIFASPDEISGFIRYQC
jgi:hypothetical protein